RIEYPGFYIGLPRPASAVVIVAFLSSHLFALPYVHLVGYAFITAICALNLALVPFRGHHRRGFAPAVRALLIVVIASTLIAIPFGYLWDAALLWSGAYALLQVFFI